MNKFEKKYAKVMRKKEELTLGNVTFLFSAIRFIVTTGKLAEFMAWQVKEAEREQHMENPKGLGHQEGNETSCSRFS